MKQNKKKTLKILVKIAIYALILIIGVNFWHGFKNFNANKNLILPESAVNEQGLIINQSKLTEFSYGVKKANKNGCGVIAVYNFLKLHNQQPNFQNLLRYFDAYGTYAFGTLGTDPFAIQTYLKLKGFNAGITVNRGEMNTLAQKSGVSILMYFYPKGAHFIALSYCENENKFLTYNEIYGSVKQRTFDEIFSVGNRNKKFCILIYIS